MCQTFIDTYRPVTQRGNVDVIILDSRPFEVMERQPGADNDSIQIVLQAYRRKLKKNYLILRSIDIVRLMYYFVQKQS